MADRLTVLTECESIRDVLSLYCERLDEADFDGVGECFSEEATADYGPGRGGLVKGRSAIAERIAHGQAAFRRTHHQLGQIRTTLRGDEADTLSYATCWHERYSGEREIVCLRYIDVLRRADRWLIVHRRTEVSWVEGFPGTAWTWVTRKGLGADVSTGEIRGG